LKEKNKCEGLLENVVTFSIPQVVVTETDFMEIKREEVKRLSSNTNLASQADFAVYYPVSKWG